MQFQLPINSKQPETRINYRDKILLTGSCFTEHIGNSLSELKFSVLQNPMVFCLTQEVFVIH
jgi:hypothetical protein